MAKFRQTDKFDGDEFEREDRDEYSEDILDDTDNRDEDEGREGMGNALSSFKLSSGAIIITAIVLVLIIVALVFFKPFSGDDSGEGFSIGKFFGRDGSLGDDILSEEGNSTMSYEESLVEFLEGYTTKDNGDGTYTVTGEQDGKKHEMIYDGSFNILFETIGDVTTEYKLDEETGERVPVTPLTADNTIIPEQNAEIVEGDDMVKVDRWSYEHSTLGMKPVELNVEYNESGVAVTKSYKDKFIVEYTKLPLRGKTPQVYVKLMDLNVDLVFNVSIENYLSLGETGASMISATVTEIGGEKMFHDISFTNWK